MIAVLLLLAATAPAAPAYRCGFTTAEVKIDGRMDEKAWNEAAWTEAFVDVASGEPATVKTRVKLLWDEKNLYVAAEMEEPDVAATIREHDAPLWQEKAFEIFLDPGNDGTDYVEIEINPLGTVLDLVMSKPYSQRGKADLAWTAEGLQSAVHVDGTINDASDRDRGWSAEMAIPWTALAKIAAMPKAGERWRVELARVKGTKPREYWTWSPTRTRNFHVPDKWGWVEFIR